MGIDGFAGPVVPRRMTGALKLILLGKLGGGWKLEPLRPGCWEADCMPGAGVTPGADMPGGRATTVSNNDPMGALDNVYPFLAVDPCPAGLPGPETLQKVAAVHIADYLCLVSV